MFQKINATKARNNFGEVIKQAKIAPVIIERHGKEEIVIISKRTYDQLTAAKKADLNNRLEALHTQIRTELAGRTLPDPTELIHQGREES